jgi:hypothetical protein
VIENLLQISAKDIQDEQNPKGDPNLLIIGDGDDDYPESRALSLRDQWVDYVQCRTPERYRKMFSTIEGEIIVDYALEGQRTAKLGLTPVNVSSVFLYYNFFRNYQRPYGSRDKSEAMSGFAVTEAGTITFATALRKGDIVIADYSHGATAGCLYLKRIALLFITASILDDLPGMSRDEVRAETMRRQAFGDLDRLKRGEAGLPLFDELRLVAEYETRNAGNTMEFEVPGGYL